MINMTKELEGIVMANSNYGIGRSSFYDGEQ